MSDSLAKIDFETFIKENPTINTTVDEVVPEQPTKPIPSGRGEVLVPTKIKIQKSNLHNQGVFANQDILEGEIIESCPLLQLAWRAQYQSDPTIKTYMWANKKCNCKDCKLQSPIAYFPLGYGSLYNHSDEPNVSVTINWKDQTATFKAMKTILVEEELLIKYEK